MGTNETILAKSINDWAVTLDDHRLSFPMTSLKSLHGGPPVIGHTPERQPQRWLWSRVCRIGYTLHYRMARFEKHEGDGYDAPEEYWLKRDWRWLKSAGAKSRAAMPQPIYDPNWKPPAKITMEWGSADPPTP